MILNKVKVFMIYRKVKELLTTTKMILIIVQNISCFLWAEATIPPALFPIIWNNVGAMADGVVIVVAACVVDAGVVVFDGLLSWNIEGTFTVVKL